MRVAVVSDLHSNAEGLEATVASLSRNDVPCDSRIVDVADREAMHAWADDIAAAVLYLASPAASWVTGQNIRISGGA